MDVQHDSQQFHEVGLCYYQKALAKQAFDQDLDVQRDNACSQLDQADHWGTSVLFLNHQRQVIVPLTETHAFLQLQ